MNTYALIYYKIKGGHNVEQDEEEDNDDVILWFGLGAEIIHSVCELSLSRSDATGQEGRTIKAVRNHIRLLSHW